MKKLILIGGGGHCKSCINAIELMDNVMIEEFWMYPNG